ncbi:unnamed protein product [Gongylonema pulchrum]|uniref:Pyridoxal kinase n=1 Tax=Gongylonema pulchrum TaxID=637853 RepID=A0A183EG39_9BILA|nr:unnamed protein product [Gongylonema pulchrum]
MGENSAADLYMENSSACRMAYEELRRIPPVNRHILSIQSHVVHGYVGNKCSVFPLQVYFSFLDEVFFSFLLKIAILNK